MTAKVGYAMAVARGAIDPSQGRPQVVDSILGRVDEVGRSVGTLAEPRILGKDALHDVTIHVDERTRSLFARVQYLASAGSPVYGVILGSIDAPFVPARSLADLRRHPSDCKWATHAGPISGTA